MQALKPDLYTVTAGAVIPQLRGGRCTCGHVFFPMQTYGCERCGRTGEALAPALLDGTGALVASARVLLHAGKSRAAPFVVVSVKLDAGPVVRTLLADDREAPLPIGTRLVARLVEVGRGEAGEAVVDLRFAPVPGGSNAAVAGPGAAAVAATPSAATPSAATSSAAVSSAAASSAATPSAAPSSADRPSANRPSAAAKPAAA